MLAKSGFTELELRNREFSAETSGTTETGRAPIRDHRDTANERPEFPLFRTPEPRRSHPPCVERGAPLWPCARAHLRPRNSPPHHRIPTTPAAPKLGVPGRCTCAPPPRLKRAAMKRHTHQRLRSHFGIAMNAIYSKACETLSELRTLPTIHGNIFREPSVLKALTEAGGTLPLPLLKPGGQR